MDALTSTREEWAANAERSVRLSCYAHERIPAGHAIYAWPWEAQDLAARTRALLTVRLRDTTGEASATRLRRTRSPAANSATTASSPSTGTSWKSGSSRPL